MTHSRRSVVNFAVLHTCQQCGSLRRSAEGEPMRRRDFIAAFSGAATAWPLAARAQRPGMPVVGFVNVRSDARTALALRKGLSEAGCIEGQNVTVEYHEVGGQYDRLPALMADLVRRRVAV